MPNTEQNLMAAFAGESQANRKYLAFAKKAEEEGLAQIAKLFRAVASAETIHALHHLRAAGKVGSTLENLQAAIDGETYEAEKMYPEMITDAKAEGKAPVEKYFDWTRAVEAEHAKLYAKALAAQGKVAAVDYYVCQGCGYTHEGPVDKCPICGAGASRFEKAG